MHKFFRQQFFYKLILITHRKNTPLDEYLKFIKICAISGITAVQLREKNASYEFLFEFGTKLKEILNPHNIPLIINDHLDLAVELDADGVHLGQTDDDPLLARTALGPEKIIGVSIDSLANLDAANNLSIDYVGIGAIFPTFSKADVATIWGIENLRKLSRSAKHKVVAVGGINEFNAASVVAAGVDGIAVIGAIHDAHNPVKTIKRLCKIIEAKSVVD